MRNRQDNTSIDLKNEEKLMQFKNYLLKLNNNVDKNKKILIDYLDLAKKHQNNITSSPSKLYQQLTMNMNDGNNGFNNDYENNMNNNNISNQADELNNINNRYQQYNTNNTPMIHKDNNYNYDNYDQNNPFNNQNYQLNNNNNNYIDNFQNQIRLNNSNSMPNVLSKSQNIQNNKKYNIINNNNYGQDYEFTHLDKRTDITDLDINYKQNNPEYYIYKNVYIYNIVINL